MSGDPFDAQGEAREALRTAVSSYGDRVLNDPRILGNLVTDLLPDSPRERSLLVTAAEAGVASELAQHVQQQHLDPDTAVSLVARQLTEHRSIDIAASTWVATEYARALGYQVRAAAPPSAAFDEDDAPGTATVRRPRSSSPAPFPVPPTPVSQPPVAQSPVAPPLFPQSQSTPPYPGQQSPGVPQSPQAPPIPFGQERGYQPTVFQAPPSQPSQPQSPYQASSQPPAGFQQPSSQPQSPYQASSQPPSQPAGYQPPSYMQQPGQPQGFQQGAQPAGYPMPGVQGPTVPGGWGGGSQPPIRQGGSRKGLLWGGIGGGVVIIGVIIAVILASSPSPKHTPNGGGSITPPVTTAPPTTPPVTTPPPTPHPTLPAGITKLTSLLPSDINDFETECVNQTAAQLPFKTTGLVQGVKCDDPGLPNGTVFAFQFASAHDYVTSWQSFNKWWGFNASTASNNCPPSGSGSNVHGVNGWNSGTYPERSGQVVECQYVTSGSSSSTAASNLEPDYVWSYPSEYAFVDGQGAAGTSFTALQNWWHNT